MRPDSTITDVIYRGTQWDGKALTCYSDSAKTVPTSLTGCTATCKIKHISTSDSVTIPCSIATNVITVGPLTMAATAAMTLGTYKGDLIITWPGAIKRGIYSLFTLTVQDAEALT